MSKKKVKVHFGKRMIDADSINTAYALAANGKISMKSLFEKMGLDYDEECIKLEKEMSRVSLYVKDEQGESQIG